MKRQRIFIAINLPEDIRDKLTDYQKKIEGLFTPYRSGASGSGPIRWTKLNNIHITLVFLGYVGNEELVEICKIAKEVAARSTPFEVNLNKICYGPTDKKPYSETSSLTGRPAVSGNRPPRMVWAVGKRSEEFSALKEDLDKSLASLENREFIPHITLGRIRKWEWQRIEPEEMPEVEEEINLSFPVDSIEVMESVLKRDGPKYVILESAFLGE